MDAYRKLKFVLGSIRHPGQAWPRIREISRIANAPPLQNTVPSDVLAEVRVIPVTSDKSLQGILVAIYADNPSPFVKGPKSIPQLQNKLESGIKYFLVENNEGEFVGARAFDPRKKTLQNTVTDFKHRGKGYQLSAGQQLMHQLAQEGQTVFRAAVLRTNTRVLRTMQAAGWQVEDDPDNPDLLRGTLHYDCRV